MITVRSDADQTQINVRSGPGTYYDKVGVLLVGQQAPAKGKSVGGDWILIEYAGVVGSQAWVYAPLVDVQTGNLPVVEPPPTPTPLVTPTINPTLAAQFVITAAPSRLPTYTAPPPLAIPTFSQMSSQSLAAGVPAGMIIIGLFAVGLVLGLFSIAQSR
ncbi:MAG: SH3 domain-containing protein [Chloroflexi bacterium]|nr:SH3 domain-containing protein [Chloroflexota bacterium]